MHLENKDGDRIKSLQIISGTTFQKLPDLQVQNKGKKEVEYLSVCQVVLIINPQALCSIGVIAPRLVLFI